MEQRFVELTFAAYGSPPARAGADARRRCAARVLDAVCVQRGRASRRGARIVKRQRRDESGIRRYVPSARRTRATSPATLGDGGELAARRHRTRTATSSATAPAVCPSGMTLDATTGVDQRHAERRRQIQRRRRPRATASTRQRKLRVDDRPVRRPAGRSRRHRRQRRSSGGAGHLLGERRRTGQNAQLRWDFDDGSPVTAVVDLAERESHVHSSPASTT